MSAGLASSLSRGQLLELLGDLPGGGDHGAPVVEQGLRAGGAHVVGGDAGVLVDELEVLGLHAELVGDQLAQRHHGAGAALLCAGDDLPAAVAVDLHVRARTAPRSSATSRWPRRWPRRRGAARRTRPRRWRRGCTAAGRSRRTPGRSDLRRRCRPRSSSGTRRGPCPMALATSSVWLSSAQQVCGAVGARTEPDGWWLV